MQASPQRSERSEAPAAADPAGAPTASLLVVTADDALWAPLAAAARGRDARQFDSAAELVGQWEAERAAVVLLDGRDGTTLESEIQQLLTFSTALVPVAIVDEEARVAATGLERKRMLFDHLLLPIDPGTARTVLERASEEALARQSLAASETVPTSAVAGRRPRALALWAGIAVAAIAVAGGAGWWLTRPTRPAPVPARPAVPAAQPTAAVPTDHTAAGTSADDLEGQLERARIAMREKHYVEPAGNSALAHYRTVLDLDPQNGEARQGLDRIAELLVARAASAVASKDYGGALRALEIVRSLKPDHPRLAALDQEVGQHLKDLSVTQVQAALQANAFARATTLLAQAEKSGTISADQIAQLRAEAARREAAAQLTEIARVAQVRITQGRLLEPAGDSAKFYLQELQSRGAPAADVLARLEEAYVKRLDSEARAAISRAAWSDADALIGELRIANGGTTLAQARQRDADRAREQQRTRVAEAADASANADAARAASVTPPAAPAPTPAAAPVAVVQAKLARALTLDYPPRAAANGTQGAVTVGFDVTTRGAAENVHVIEADPPGVFDSAAVAAIKRARFTPAQAADGTPVAQPTTLKVRFALDTKK